MLVVGLTGGIGSGKSTVSNLFAEKGVPVIDADEIAHRLVTPGSDASIHIANVFGSQFFSEAGELDRAALRDVVFHDHYKRKELETILHPRIRDSIAAEVKQLDACYCIIVIPLLVETGGNPLVKRVLVVDCPEEQQVERVMRRNRLSVEEVKAILAAQTDRQTRLEIADDIIDNSQATEQLQQQVEALHRQYLELCQSS